MTIDPRLGEEADFIHFIDAARSRGLDILADGVFNHVGHEFPRFCTAAMCGPDSEPASWFRRKIVDDGHPSCDYDTFEGHDALITLNHEEVAVQTYTADVMTYWLDRGISGWRLDAAYATPRNFWSSVLPRVRRAHPEAYIFGEVIHGDYAGFVRETGADAVTQYELWKAIWSSLNNGNCFELAWSLTRHSRYLEEFVPITFIGNHDVTRIASRLHDPRHLPHALAILFTIGGTPCIYAGDEQGFRGVKEDRIGGDDEIRPCFPDVPDGLAPYGWDTYRLHKELVMLRRQRPWLNRAKTSVNHLASRVITMTTSLGEDSLFIALSLEDHEVTVQIPRSYRSLVGTGNIFSLDSPLCEMRLPPHGWAVMEVSRIFGQNG
jgi:cyclomaltodextrinase